MQWSTVSGYPRDVSHVRVATGLGADRLQEGDGLEEPQLSHTPLTIMTHLRPSYESSPSCAQKISFFRATALSRLWCTRCDTRCIVWFLWLCSWTDAPAAALLRKLQALGKFAAMPGGWPASSGAEQLRCYMPDRPAADSGSPVHCHRGSHLEGDKRDGGRPCWLAKRRYQRRRASSPLRVVRCKTELCISLPSAKLNPRLKVGGCLLCRGVLLHIIRASSWAPADDVGPKSS